MHYPLGTLHLSRMVAVITRYINSGELPRRPKPDPYDQGQIVIPALEVH